MVHQEFNMEGFKETYTAPKLAQPLPTVDFSQLSQPVKSEPQISVLISAKIKRELCPSPKSRLGPRVLEVPASVKSEILSPLSSPVNPNSVKSEDTSCSVTTSPALTTELENFQDLTEWCHRAHKTPNMSFSAETDELNTPVPELGDFWFTSPTTIDNPTNECYGLLNVLGQSGSPELYNGGADIQSNKLNDLDSQIFGNDSTDNLNNIKSETYQYSNVFIGGGEVQENLKTKSVTFTNNYNNNITNTTVYSGLNQQTSATTEMQSSSTAPAGYEYTEEIVSFAPSSSIYELPAESVTNLSEFVSFPLESVAPQTPVTKVLPRLDFSNIWIENKQIISTPEVINTALSLETGFNLVDFITEGNIEAEEVSPSSLTKGEEDSQSRCPSTSIDIDPAYTPSESSDDEDEEYEPPWKKQKTPSRSLAKPKKQQTKSPVQRLDLDSDVSNASTVESVKVVRRGRPPKRNASISLDSTGDSETSRYRELRDKNNEASRRSRLNRKKKEQELEDEAGDLDVRNRKLKVRVQELERLVNTMRTNLMQMLLKK